MLFLEHVESTGLCLSLTVPVALFWESISLKPDTFVTRIKACG